ncbi:MAG TPA: hypothetical protein VGM67_19680 [Gemmatimonadaceae bacterium]|jgi:hypothetical protein
MTHQPAPDIQLPEIAYYYPNATWRMGSSAFIKNLLLYFDGVGILVPEYLQDKQFTEDPEVAPALKERGLLHVFLPERVVDKGVTEKLVASSVDILLSGALDHLANDAGEFHSLSYSRLGFFGDEGLAQMLLEELEKKGLARRSLDGHSIPMHPLARSMVLVLLAQILRSNSHTLGVELCPTTDRPEVLQALGDLLNSADLPSAGKVVSLDLNHVGVDLSDVPIDQVLEFRQRHGPELQSYARDVRAFVRLVGVVPESERRSAYPDREAELKHRAFELARESQSYWRQPAAFLLGILGAAATLAGASGFGAAFAAGGAFANLGSPKQGAGGAYSYIFKARGLQS